MSLATTQGIKVEVESEYMPERSDVERGYYFFAYHVTITNEGDETVQLLTRHWIITDSNGKMEEVKGEGVIGEQPVLQSGESHQYSSFCPLNTPVGTMHGTFQMVTDQGELFDAKIAPFQLAYGKEMFH